MSHYENVPFEVPEGWCWCKLDSVGEIVTGSTPPKDNVDYYGGSIPFYKPTDLEQGINTIEASDSLTELGFSVSRQLPSQSILVTCIGATIGKTGLIQKRGTCNQQINAIISNDMVLPEYLYYTCISGYMQSEIIGRASATTLPILNKNKFSEIPIPVPPIQEQHRIISKIETLFSFVIELENSDKELIGSISIAKSKILDLAIHGKLVPQNANDEPASKLLKRINPKAVASCDNPQYGKVPSNWVWCKIEDIFNVIMGQSPKGDSVNHELIGIEFHQGKILFSQCVVEKSDIYTTSPTKIADKDSLLVCVRAPVGDVNITDRDICIGRGLCALKPLSNMPLEYWFYAIKNLKLEFNKKATGSTFLAISAVTIKSQAISLPPIEEQHRIVSKINELFSQLDMIEKSLQA